MANTGAKLSSFPEVNDIQTGDMFPLLSGGDTNAKIDYATLADAIIAKLKSEAGDGVLSINGKTGAVNLSKADVGLSNVDNTSDADKPVSTAVQNALDGKANNSVATSSADGLMSKADKAKLDEIGAGSNVKSVNGKTGAVTLAKSDVGLSSVANLDQSKAIKSIARSGTTFTATALDGTTTTFTQQDNDTTYGVATSSADGLMSKSDKAKLDGISSGADVSQLAKNIAQIETAGTATNAHSAGEYVMISNVLYKVTASVAKGDTWTIGTNVTAANIGSEIGSLKSDLANKLYPVGSIYMSVYATNPAELFGGTWERLKDRFLLAAGDSYAAGSTGGEATHRLTIDEMPSHAHEMAPWMWAVSLGFNTGTYNILDMNTGNADPYNASKSRQKQYSTSTGGGLAHNNMPPYLAVYMWKRTA